MSIAVSENSPQSPASCAPPVTGFSGRQRRMEAQTNRVRRDGKFFRLGDEKFYVKGVTYGPFKPGADGLPLPDRAQAQRDFQQMLELGANCLRIYHTPPVWFLDLAQEMGLARWRELHRCLDAAGAGCGAKCRAGVRESSGRAGDQRG